MLNGYPDPDLLGRNCVPDLCTKVASFFVIYRQKHSNRYFRCTEHVNANKKNKYFITHKWTNDKLCTAL